MRLSKSPSHNQSFASHSKNPAAVEENKSARRKANVRDAAPTSADNVAEETAYLPIFANIAKVMCQNGAAYWQLALAFKVDENTIRGWIRSHQDFAAGCKYGMDFADHTVERSLYELAVGSERRDVKIFRYKGRVIYAPYTKHVPASVEACVFWLINRRVNGWNADSNPTPDADDNGALMRLYEWMKSTEAAPGESQKPCREGVRRSGPEGTEDAEIER